MGREDGYKIRNKEGIHFITFAVVEWIVVFTRKAYRDIVLESIRYCQKETSLELYCWCLLSNPICPRCSTITLFDICNVALLSAVF